MSETLRTALREACADLRRHNDGLFLTPMPTIEAWERLADEQDPEAFRAAVRGYAATARGDHSESSIDAELDCKSGVLVNTQSHGFDRLQASLVAPVRLRLFAAAPLPTHAALCCARLGSVWCTEPDGHSPPCKGPEEREIRGNEFGKGRKCSENVNSSKEQR